MATIWDDVNHSSGETFELSSNAPRRITEAFRGLSKTLTKISESEYINEPNQVEINIPDSHVMTPRSIVFYFKDKTKAFKVVADRISSAHFRWNTVGASTNRNKLTLLKELCSLTMILHKINNTGNAPDCSDKLAAEVAETYRFSEAPALMREVYFTSAIAHADEATKLPLLTGKGIYVGELQKGNITKDIYDLARLLTLRAADNWNPSDIWLAKFPELYKIKPLIREIKAELVQGVLSKQVLALKLKETLNNLSDEGILIGVSLKQVDRGASKLQFISFDDVKKNALDMDFKVTKKTIRTTQRAPLPAYGELVTKSGFSIKFGGRARKELANIYSEGHMAGSTHQIGAIDSAAIDRMARAKRLVILKDSFFKNLSSIEGIYDEYIGYLKKYHKDTHKKYVGNRSKVEMLSEYDFVSLKRFFATISVARFMGSLSQDEILDMYLLSKKVSNENPNYHLLN